MELFITLALVLGVFIIPGLINFYVNRYFAPADGPSFPKLDLLTASLTLTFAILVLDVLGVLVIAAVWDGLKDDIADFVQMGLLDFARDRPIALTSVLTAYSTSCMVILGLLGALRVPSRFLR
jgi:hypothetical protein